MSPETHVRQFDRIRNDIGFFAALDQSGGSTPKALRSYGIDGTSYTNNDEMFALVHEMRTRIVTNPAFRGDRIIGAILFERTMDGQFDGEDAPDYLWNQKEVVSFLKVDRGLADETNGVQVMKPMRDLEELLARAQAKRIFGTKMRSVIKRADPVGVVSVVDQQFAYGRRIIDAGFVPIIEPEVDIHSPDKAEAEELLRSAITDQVNDLAADQWVMLKLTLPDTDDFYSSLVQHERVLRVLALSGGYSRAEANRRLARNRGVIASFSRALVEGLTFDQTDDAFQAALDESIHSIFEASENGRPNSASSTDH